MKQWKRRFRRLLGANRTPRPIDELWRSQGEGLTKAVVLVRAFYLCLFFILIQNYPSWPAWLQLRHIEALWPIWWFGLTGIHAGVVIVIGLSLVGVLLAGAWPTVWWVRLIAAIGILEFAAFFTSFGIVNHGWHVWIWAAAIFVLLPDGTMEPRTTTLSQRQRYLRVFWFALASPLLFYSLSGGLKLGGIALQLSRGQLSALAPDALARQVAYRVQEGAIAGNSMLGSLIIRHPMLGWPFYLLALYIEVFSIFVAFRPAAHRLWGFMIICMHVGVYLILAIMFSWQMLAVGLLLMCSPFAPPGMGWKQSVRELPVICDILGWTRLGRRIARAPIIAVTQSDVPTPPMT